jgi:hypothetical protein
MVSAGRREATRPSKKKPSPSTKTPVGHQRVPSPGPRPLMVSAGIREATRPAANGKAWRPTIRSLFAHALPQLKMEAGPEDKAYVCKCRASPSGPC